VQRDNVNSFSRVGNAINHALELGGFLLMEIGIVIFEGDRPFIAKLKKLVFDFEWSWHSLVLSLGFLEEAAFVVVEGGIFRENGIIGEVGEFGAAAHGHTFLIGAPASESEKLHWAALVL
jgi:hypothetical protein